MSKAAKPSPDGLRIRRVGTTRWRRRGIYEVELLDGKGEVQRRTRTPHANPFIVTSGGVHTTDAYDWVRAADDAFARGSSAWITSLY